MVNQDWSDKQTLFNLEGIMPSDLHLENWTARKRQSNNRKRKSYSTENCESERNRRFLRSNCGESTKVLLQISYKRTEITHNLKLRKTWSEKVRITAGQAVKGARGMPWHQEPMKDVTSCDKLGGAANKHWSQDFRMGKPAWGKLMQPMLNQIGIGGEPPELKHLSRARKRHQQRFRQ